MKPSEKGLAVLATRRDSLERMYGLPSCGARWDQRWLGSGSGLGGWEGDWGNGLKSKSLGGLKGRRDMRSAIAGHGGKDGSSAPDRASLYYAAR